MYAKGVTLKSTLLVIHISSKQILNKLSQIHCATWLTVKMVVTILTVLRELHRRRHHGCPSPPGSSYHRPYAPATLECQSNKFQCQVLTFF